MTFLTVLNQYVLRQVMTMTLFITLVLTGAVWLTQSLRFVDFLINRGVGIGTFFKLINLLLPEFLVIILPIAAFLATLIVYVKMAVDRELLVLRGAGLSNLQLAKPALLWGLFLTVMLYGINLYLLPISFQRFRDLEFSLRQNSAIFALQAGEFNSTSQMTAYVRSRKRTGELQGIMLYDQRQSTRPITVVAQQGQVYGVDGKTYLKMQNGSHQVKQNGKISVLYFEEFVMDLTPGSQPLQPREKKPHEQFVSELWQSAKEADAQEKRDKLRAEAHGRLVRPLYALCFMSLFLGLFLPGEYRRHRRHRRAGLAVVLMIILQGLGLWMVQLIARYPSLTAGLYALVLIPCGVSLAVLGRPYGRALKAPALRGGRKSA